MPFIHSRGVKAILIASLIVTTLFALWVAFPRRPTLTGFDPEAMAQADTAMWRAYYDKRYRDLFTSLFSLLREQYGFSPLDSLRIAYAAASAARTFQPSKSRLEASAALPDLVTYYSLVAKAAPAAFDVVEAARAELDWWQARRENAAADSYGLTIARTSALVLGLDNPQIREAGVLRARAMDYRDARGKAMTEKDWIEVYNQLLASYRSLKSALQAR